MSARSAEAAFAGQNGRIAFVSDRDSDFDIYTIRPDGSGLRQVTNAPGSDSRPEWSPDGTKIAFNSDRDTIDELNGEAYVERIYVMKVDGSELTRLTRTFNY